MDRGAGRRSGLVGREAELALLEQHLSLTAGDGPRHVLLEGSAGIGKTSLWEAGARTATARGARVLVARPARSETRLSYAALADLLAEPLGEVAPRLPGAQRRALEVALLLADPDHEEIDQRTVSAAALGVLRELASSGRVVLAVDDIQWLDAPSAAALGFVLPRIGEADVAFLGSVRRDGSTPPTGLEDVLERRAAGTLHRISVGPLGVSEIRAVLRSRLGVSFPAETLRRLVGASAGNPLYAIELARAMGDGRHLASSRPLPLSPSLHQLIAERVSALPAPVIEALRIASACARPSLAVLRRAGASAGGIDGAVAAGVLVPAGAFLRFEHPLIASALYEQLGPAEAGELHRRLATAVDATAERARHLALGADEPDEETARTLEEVARQSFARGAPGEAAELAERAVTTTPEADRVAVLSRVLLACDLHLRVGNLDSVRRLAEPFAGEPEGAARLATAMLLQGDSGRAWELVEQAEDDGRTSATTRARLALLRAATLPGEPRTGSHSRRAVRLAHEAGDVELEVLALQRAAFDEGWVGRDGVPALERAARSIVEKHPSDAKLLNGSLAFGAIHLWFADDVDGARPVLLERLRRSADLGDVVVEAETSVSLSELERRAGNLGRALEHAEHGLALAADELYIRAPLAYVTSMASTLVGDLDRARESAERCAAWASAGPPYAPMQAAWATGFIALAEDDAAAAAVLFEPIREQRLTIGLANPTPVPYHADAVEAFVAAERLDDARLLATELERCATEQGHAWARAASKRCRGLIAGARGDVDEGIALLDAAAASYERIGRPVELGRTLLSRGVVERRAKRRAAARTTLTSALELFDALGIARWAARSAAELQRLPGRRPSSTGGLTDTERQVADLVADGLSNKEVAARLFVTVRTVEANLTKVYAKLGVGSRTELAARLRR